MKRLIVILSAMLTLCAANSFAQEKFASLAEGKRVSMTHSFLVKMKKGNIAGNGTFISEGRRFVLVADDVTVYNNTETMWILNDSSREVIIQRGSDVDFLREPQQVLSLFGLNPAGVSMNITYRKENGFPFQISATMADKTSANILIASVRLEEKGNPADFSFNVATLDDSWFVTDLR